jgi:hypothetical protein
VREHYPVANLPEDLREGLEEGAMVRVVVEVEQNGARTSPPPMTSAPTGDQRPLSIKETQALLARIRSQDRPSVSAEEAVARIRELRDEWDY